jgi:hypothetical protein
MCTLGKEPAPVMAETFLHFFFECTFSGKYRLYAEQKFFFWKFKPQQQKGRKYSGSQAFYITGKKMFLTTLYIVQ